MKAEKNVILVDNDVQNDWKFKEALEKSTNEMWEIYKVISNKNHGNKLQLFIRYIKYFMAPMIIFLKRKSYKRVLAWQQFYGLILAFYFRMFKVKKTPDITIMTFIYKPKKNVIGKVYENFIRYIITSGYIKKIIVFSKNEKQYYAKLFNVSDQMFEFVTLGYEDKTKIIKKQNSEMYFLSAGRSNRDYEFLMNAWKKEEKNILKIICDTVRIDESNQIEVLNNCYDNEYFRQLSGSYAVIVPIRNEEISSGQLVIIQAMMYGKPVIVTENATVRDYVVDGQDGFIIAKNSKELKKAINKLLDKECYALMSKNARKHYEEKFSIYAMGYEVGKIIEKMN